MKTSIKSSIIHTFKGDATLAQQGITAVIFLVPIITLIFVLLHSANVKF
jgi:hypothetical protein